MCILSLSLDDVHVSASIFKYICKFLNQHNNDQKTANKIEKWTLQMNCVFYDNIALSKSALFTGFSVELCLGIMCRRLGFCDFW